MANTIDTHHKELRRLAKELALTVKDLFYDNGPNGHCYFFENRLIPSDTDFIDMFRPVAQAITSDLEQMKVHGKISYDSPHGREVDRLNMREWFEKRGVTGLITKVLRAAYVGEYGLEIDQQSALNLLLEIGEESAADEFHLFGDSDERFHIAEGNDSVPTRLAQRLQRDVELDTHLEAIASEGSRFCLTVRRDNASTDIKAEILVLALPFTILRELRMDVDLPGAKRKAIHELGYGTNAKLIAGCSRRVWEESSVGENAPDGEQRFDTRSSGYTSRTLVSNAAGKRAADSRALMPS